MLVLTQFGEVVNMDLVVRVRNEKRVVGDAEVWGMVACYGSEGKVTLASSSDKEAISRLKDELTHQWVLSRSGSENRLGTFLVKEQAKAMGLVLGTGGSGG